jgi:hypothetical protein
MTKRRLFTLAFFMFVATIPAYAGNKFDPQPEGRETVQVYEPPSNLLWNYACKVGEEQNPSCELLLVMEWHGVQDERFSRYLRNTEMGLASDDKAGCEAQMALVMRRGMSLAGIHDQAYTSLTRLYSATCIFVHKDLIKLFFARHPHPYIVQEVLYYYGRKTLQPPLSPQ